MTFTAETARDRLIATLETIGARERYGFAISDTYQRSRPDGTCVVATARAQVFGAGLSEDDRTRIVSIHEGSAAEVVFGPAVTMEQRLAGRKGSVVLVLQAPEHKADAHVAA